MRIFKNRNKEEAGSDSFTLSVSDLMAGLLAVFILIVCSIILNFQKAVNDITIEQVDVNIKNRNEVLNIINTKMKGRNFNVIVDFDHGTVSIPSSRLFESGDATISDEAKPLFAELSKILSEALQQDRYRQSIETIFVEGHTDNEPINTYKYPSNWQLSADRAIQTWQFMNVNTGLDVKLDSFKNKKNQLIFSCSGYGESRPVEFTEEELKKLSKDDVMARNRRIDIRFAVTGMSKEDLEKLKKGYIIER